MKLENLVTALNGIVDTRNIDKDVVIEALKEAIIKAFRKHIDVNDAYAEVTVDDAEGGLHLYRLFEVKDEVEDDALEIETKEAQKIDPSLKEGDFYREEFPIVELGRSAAQLAKQVLKQKIREAEKQGVYDEYIDLKDDMIIGVVQSVEDRFTIVNLGKTMAIMPKSQQIPQEVLREGQQIRVVITSVSKDSKGAQVVVSRSDANLVKRLFEKEVPEIYEGVVEIKAIARDAGERTKMAVYSHNEDVDPIGACIGPRGSRVQVVIEELKGEKIDIFEWSEDTVELIKNALSPAEVLAVFENDDKKGLVVVVDDKQLSLAIGRGGKNARLAVRLTKEKIDIKSMSDIVEMGIDYRGRMEDYRRYLEEERQQKALKKQQELLESYRKQQEEAMEQAPVEEDTFEDDFYQNLDDDHLDQDDIPETIEEPSSVEEAKPAESQIFEESSLQEEVEEKVPETPKPKITIRQRQQYVSKFEALADASRPTKEEPKKKRKKRFDANKDEEDNLKRLNTAEMLSQMEYDIKPTYTDEELAEIEDDSFDDWYDEVDYDEFDDYYDKD